jgi:hypothetical protein
MSKVTSLLAFTFALLVAAYLAIHMATALPSGSTITTNATAGTPNPTPSNRTDTRGTITTILLNSVQQDQYWKGYVGNISGRLSLDDASGNTIYDWPLSLTKIGEVYLSRASSPTFSNVSCANINNITAEEAYFGMTSLQSDNINKTFNATNHQAFFVGSQSITANSCRSALTYINDTAQSVNNAYFAELVLMDIAQNLIYTTIINSSTHGFSGLVYDFQMIVPESAVNSSTTYYFFTELG